MGKYKTDTYLAFLFDSYGSKLDTLEAGSYLDAIRLGAQAVENNEAIESYAVLRTLYNSKDVRQRWELTEEQEARYAEDS